MEFRVGVAPWDRSEHILPRAVCEWLGIPQSPEVITGSGARSCGNLNDSARRSFSQIADAIERTWLTPDA